MASHEETSWSWTPSKFPMLRDVAFITNATSRAYLFSLFRVSGVSGTRRRLICSITSAAIIPGSRVRRVDASCHPIYERK